MRIKNESAANRWRRLKEPHDWFAWFPVRVSGTEVAWLETVRRRGASGYGGVYWLYEPQGALCPPPTTA